MYSNVAPALLPESPPLPTAGQASPILGYAAFQITSTTNSSMTGYLVTSGPALVGTGAGGGVGTLISAPPTGKIKLIQWTDFTWIFNGCHS